MSEQKKSHRFPEVDAWRGVAILGMVFFHFIFLINFLEIERINYDIGVWRFMARAVQWSFLLLVGIGVQLSYQTHLKKGKEWVEFLQKSLKRAFVILACAMLISLTSLLAVGELFVRFGILHLIAVSILCITPFVRQPLVAFLAALAIFLFTPFVAGLFSELHVLMIFGVRVPPFASLDYFPLFPWLSIPFLGIALGNRMFHQLNRQYYWNESWNQTVIIKFLAAAGKRSLLIYMIHVPLLVVMLWPFIG